MVILSQPQYDDSVTETIEDNNTLVPELGI